MEKKPSIFQRIRTSAEALLDERKAHLAITGSKAQRFIHFWILVGRSFARNRCPVRASALAYATFLALIPMLAVAMSVTSTFLKKEGEAGIEKFIEKLVASVTPPAAISENAAGGTNSVPESPLGEASTEDEGDSNGFSSGTNNSATAPSPKDAVIAGTNAVTGSALNSGTAGEGSLFQHDSQAAKARNQVARRINQFIQNTQSGAIGVTGTVLLIFAAISMLSSIENTFNDIWGVAHGRSWFMRIVLYWGVLSLAPILIVLALGLATGPHLKATQHFVAALPVVGSFLFQVGFQLLPILVLCLTFSMFYMLIPNTRVDWRGALVGGLVGGLLFHLNNLVSVLYVSRVVSNSKIYGSLALVPVFMIGLYFSWLILLFGAQVAYAFQNRTTYLEEKQVENINQRGKEFVALRLTTVVGQRYLRGESPPTISELSEQLGVPSRLIRQIMQTLAAAKLVVETAGEETGYLPARLMETITCYDILQAMRVGVGQDLATREEPMRTEVYGEFQRIQEAERQAAGSVTMMDLANRALSARELKVS